MRIRPVGMVFAAYVVAVVVSLIISSAVAVVWWTVRPQPAPDEPVPVHFSDLAPAVNLRGQHLGQRVRVAYPLPLRPTPDPLVWEFRPGSESLPPTHRIHFADVPTLGRTPVVVGTVEGIQADGIVRLNNVPGVVVLKGATVISE